MKDDFMPISGEFIMRGNYKDGEKGTMVLGFIPGVLLEKFNEDEVWIMQFIVADVKKFKLDKRFSGYRADQLLCSSISPDELKEMN